MGCRTDASLIRQRQRGTRPRADVSLDLDLFGHGRVHPLLRVVGLAVRPGSSGASVGVSLGWVRRRRPRKHGCSRQAHPQRPHWNQTEEVLVRMD